VVGISRLLRETSGSQSPETVQKDYANEGTFSDLHEVNCARPLKIKKAERVFFFFFF
jgi:hypothetical protein